MNIQDRAALVLQQIDAALALAEKAKELETLFAAPEHASFIAASRTLLPASLRCLKTAIEGLLEIMACGILSAPATAQRQLTTLCDQWEAAR